MRKYQQLILILISIISVSVLIIYKTENRRLKYVLEVVSGKFLMGKSCGKFCGLRKSFSRPDFV